MKTYLILWVLCLPALPAFAQKTATMTDSNACYLIREIAIVTKKPRPHEKPKEYPHAYCLLNLCPERYGEVARRVIQVLFKGNIAWREFEVQKQFASKEEALAYSQAHQIAIDMPVILQGVAKNAKLGAILLTEAGKPYYLAGKEEWLDAELNQTFTLEGIIKQLPNEEEESLIDKNGNYKAGAIGTRNILIDWEVK